MLKLFWWNLRSEIAMIRSLICLIKFVLIECLWYGCQFIYRHELQGFLYQSINIRSFEPPIISLFRFHSATLYNFVLLRNIINKMLTAPFRTMHAFVMRSISTEPKTKGLAYPVVLIIQSFICGGRRDILLYCENKRSKHRASLKIVL